MKILLIFPPKEHWALRQIKLHKTVDVEIGCYPPLGILSVASYLEKYSDHEIKIIDSVIENMDYPQLEQCIIKEKPDLVGIYCLTEYLYDAILTARLVKKVDKSIFTIVGGPHVYYYPRETVLVPEIDYVVCGDGEIAFKDLVEYISKGMEVENLPGIVTKLNYEKEYEVQKIENLDGMPFPARHLIPYKRYRSILAKRNPIATMMTTRGCPYNCYYCYYLERGKKVRTRSAKNVVNEIQTIVDLGIYDIFFFDETFTFNRERTINICNEILNRKLKIRFHIRTRIDVVDEDLIKKLKQAGCRLIQFGIESGNQRMQKIINKNLNLKKVEEIVKILRDYGILTYANFMLGLPDETRGEMINTIEFAKSLKLDYAAFGVFNPYPNTELFSQGIQTGKIKKNYWYDYILKPEKPVEDYWWPDFSKQELSKMNKLALRSFYFRLPYVVQRLIKLDSLSQALWELKSAVKVLAS